ncbi:MAG: 3-hydroxybutyryl-CoA dehydrogenase [Planctomycetes bacterium]|nr:3-hydroxybutyryl-CoA dehydrogenase [Planctomycetota bacterium]
MNIRNIFVIGAGTMGGGIAQVFATYGFDVTLFDVSENQLHRAKASITKSLERMAKKELLEGKSPEEVAGKISFSTADDALAEADFVIEAATENFDLKRKILTDAAGKAREEVIVASNTSSISITALGAATGRPQKFIGMHFMNPVPVMKLVEVIRGLDTSDKTLATTVALAKTLLKTPVEVNDFPGFISNRILMPMINEAVYCLMEGVATAEAIDDIMKLGMAHPMGPLRLADLIGLDVCLDIMEVLHEAFGDSKYRPCPLLRKMVFAGHLGSKSGRGFYTY